MNARTSVQLNKTKAQSNKKHNTLYKVTLMEITSIKTTYLRNIVKFKFQPGVLYKPITCIPERILPVTGFEAVKSS
jgi:hypothetical protein